MIARRLRQVLTDRRGQALVEFAFAGPIMIVFLIGLFEAGRMLWTSHTLQYAVDETGRMAGGLLASASELSQQAELLNREVGHFLARVRAG